LFTDVLSSEDIRKVEIKVYELGSVPSVLSLLDCVLQSSGGVLLTGQCSKCMSPSMKHLMGPLYSTFGLESIPSYMPAGNCVPLNCLAIWFQVYFGFLINF
jgi:hypothetical protein